ncbi:hypothetical protein CCR75_005397 [Bremia lactucae]|uniref:Uncharacterized protein n=1 Tax=Bremia lactucae TaxID=4779 RepID=A0A976FL42_BRELC|nr:hypothetical protein CCR75_005397 [Bremia lactucae]
MNTVKHSNSSATVEAIELSSSSSECEMTLEDSALTKRPKLCTRRRNEVDEARNHSFNSPHADRPAKRRRQTSMQIKHIKHEEQEEDEMEEVDEDATEDYVDHVEASSEDEEPEFDRNRRRSGRHRKSAQPVTNLSNDDFVMSSDDEDEKRKSKSKAKQKANRKARAKKKRALAESSEEADSANDSDDDGEEPESDGFIIDKILACEVHTQKEWKKICWNKTTRFLTHCSIFLPPEDEKNEDKEEVGEDQEQERCKDSATDENVVDDTGEERFLVKWKTLSYLHASWQTEDELLETDKSAKGKIQRFREKEPALYTQEIQGDEYFNPEFRSVDRILEISDKPLDDFAPDDAANNESNLQYFLIKWKALSYDDITWEREDDVGDDAALKQYNDRIIRASKRYKKIAFGKAVSHTKRKNFRGYTAESPPPCKKEQNFVLREYQLTGVNWLLFNWYQKRNSMLADEMGLGKTVQTVMYINHLAVVEHTPQPFIIVAPLSTLGHWQREFDSWTNLNAVVYHGSAAAREILQKYEFFMSEDELVRADELIGNSSSSKLATSRQKRSCYRFDVLITTFEMASATDLYKLAQIDWQLMVVDEAHRLKNRNSKLSNILHTRYTYENMLLLTGTPLQNNVEELWVLLNFLDTENFASKENFLEKFGELTDSAQVERLHMELKPYLLRRMKEDVEKSLAPKEETIIEVELTVLQKQYYRAIYEKNTEFLSRGGKKGDTPSLMNVLMELRKCCNHPFLVKGVEEREVKRREKQSGVSKEEIERKVSESLVDTSGKLVLLDKLLPRLKDSGHRVLIFSQFKIMLDILQDYLSLRRYNGERIDGNITGNERQSAIDRFCREGSNSFIMLLSTRAGGVGINLTAADTVIIYDSDWNPQNDLQAQARCHRIGQKKSVKIYRLLTSKTYELHMFHKASLKLGLDQAVLGGVKNDDPVAKLKGKAKSKKANDRMSKEEIENLLKHGAYEMFKEKESEAEAASKQFGEESIDQILSRSTTIVHDPTRDVDGNEKKSVMSSFSKATFVSSTNPDEEVDVDDPNFWTKVIGLNGVEEQKTTEPSPLQKRRCRRKVKSYVMDDDKAESGEESTNSRKKLFPELGIQKDEEFVVSEDNDDDSSDAAMEVGAESVNSRGKRSKQPVLPIYHYGDQIADLLGCFGYGRWGDMKQYARDLEIYSDSELSKFAQEYVIGMIRVTTAIATFGRIGLELRPSQVYMISFADAGLTSPLEKYAFELSLSVRHYSFLTPMLKDMRLANLLAVGVPIQMWISDYKVQTARNLRAKLHQIDTMFRLNEFVRLKCANMPALVSVIEGLQKVGSEAEVNKLIETGTLPSSLDTSHSDKTGEAATVMETGEAVAKLLSKQTTAVINNESEGTKGADQSHVVTSAASANSKIMTSSECEDSFAKPVEAKIISQDGHAKSALSTGSAPNEKLTMTLTEDTLVTNCTSKSSKNSVASIVTNAGDSMCKIDAINLLIPSGGKVETVAAARGEITSFGEDEKVLSKEHGLKSNAPSKALTSHELEQERTEDRKQALQILRSLVPLNAPEPVAPWWIYRVDDVMLMIHVHREGWLRGRLPSSRIVDSTFFGERAKRYPLAIWPNVASLNRRLKILVHSWTAYETNHVATSATSVETLTNVTSTKNLQQQRLHQELQQQLLRLHEHQSTLQVHQKSSVSIDNVRHNQFAKLVFSYGIPDMSVCRDNRERNEKWRYFLQDSQLQIGDCPLEEVVAEARDLELLCRRRLLPGANALGDRIVSEANSILGGKRGIWLLSITQCRRLLHRVDLFRLLRSQILILPPSQLVELVSRVVKARATSTTFPAWWSSPRHDILLLQGVECYGLDELLSSVWKLPLFSSANTTKNYPSSSWVENYVTALALTCHNVIAKARTYQKRQVIDLSKDEASSGVATEYDRRSEMNQKVENMRRVREIQSMREEDPTYAASVRLRQQSESSARQEIKQREEVALNAITPVQTPLKSGDEVEQMKREDPYSSPCVRDLWADDQIKRDEIKKSRSCLSGEGAASCHDIKGAATAAVETKDVHLWDVIVIDSSDSDSK